MSLKLKLPHKETGHRHLANTVWLKAKQMTDLAEPSDYQTLPQLLVHVVYELRGGGSVEEPKFQEKNEDTQNNITSSS